MSADFSLRANALYWGDCLEVMGHWPDGCVDLVYLDPPFNSAGVYRVVGEGGDGGGEGAGFSDVWRYDEAARGRMRGLLGGKGGEAVAGVLDGLRRILPQGGMLAYLSYMAERVGEMRRVLKDSGSLYLHCDASASHYLKVVLDGIFGAGNFRNEIVWRRSGSGKGSQYAPRSFARNADVIFFYSKSGRYRVRPFAALDAESAARKFPRVAEDGRRFAVRSLFRGRTLGARPNLCYRWRGFENPTDSGWALCKARLEEEFQKGNVVILPNGGLQRRQYLEDSKGAHLSTLWTDIPAVAGRERVGYPTQKPVALVERIVAASSQPGDLVLDPFCGCGTTARAAANLKRRFLGIDIAKYPLEELCPRRLAGIRGLTIRGMGGGRKVRV